MGICTYKVRLTFHMLYADCIGDGEDFQGVYDRASKQVHLFVRGDRRKKIDANIVALDDSSLPEIIGKELFAKLMEDIDMLDGY